MKNFRLYLACLTVVCMLFTSCSKEDDSALGDDPANKGTLSFGAYLNDLVANKAALKQAVTSLPECSEDAPAYVEIVLSQGGESVVGDVGSPLRVTVNPTPQDYDNDGEAEYFTDESASLELDPGTYTLEYFTVLNADEEVIWVAPIDPGAFAGFVDTPLPMSISLGAGVKKYVDVEVLCFDDREVNEYGYLFFDLETNEAFKFCFFANYCPPSGIHFPAALSVDIWVGTNSNGVQIYSDHTNVVGVNDDGDFFARPICFALPDLSEYEDDEDYFYYEVTLTDWEGAYGDVEQVIKSGTLSRNDILANFDGENRVDYEHLRFGCDDIPNEDCPGDDDCDETPNDDDLCPGFDDRLDADGDGIPDGCDVCPDNNDKADADQDGVPDGCDVCPGHDDMVDTDEDGVPNGCDVCPGHDDMEDADGDGVPDGCDICPGHDDMNDEDQDGVPDGCDVCPEGDDNVDLDNNGTPDACDDDTPVDECPVGDCDYEEVPGCETAYMLAEVPFSELGEGFNNWGWATNITGDGTYYHEIYAAAGQENIENGYLVGIATIVVEGTDVDINIDLEDNIMQEVHIYLDDAKPTSNAPGQFTFKYEGLDDDEVDYELSFDETDDDGFWLMIHLEVCGDDEGDD